MLDRVVILTSIEPSRQVATWGGDIGIWRGAMQHFDSIVVGAGIAGTSTALFLRERGLSTALVERSHPAGGPTGSSSALTHAFYTVSEFAELAIRGAQILREIPNWTQHPPVHFEVGMMWVCGEQNEGIFSEAARRITRSGTPIEELSPAELERRYPGINLEGIVLALWEPSFGYADAYGATNAIATAARERGAVGMMGCGVRKLICGGGKIKGVELNDGNQLGSDKVVVAAGPWTKQLIKDVGYSLPIYAERHEMAVIDGAGRAREYLPFSWCDDTRGSYARPDGDRVILAGLWAGGGTGPRNPDAPGSERVSDLEHFRESLTEEEVVAILSQLFPRFPKMEELGLRPGYAALYDMSPDDEPLIGPVPGIEGLYVVCGSSGHGFKTGPAVGEEVARLVATGEAPLLRRFRVDRFKGR